MRDSGAWAGLVGGTRAAPWVPGWQGQETACGGGAELAFFGVYYSVDYQPITL